MTTKFLRISATLLVAGSGLLITTSSSAQSSAMSVEHPTLASLHADPVDTSSGSRTEDSTTKGSTEKESSTKDAAAATASGAASAPAPTVAPVPMKSDLIAKELAEMKARIAQLEADLKESKAGEDASKAD